MRLSECGVSFGRGGAFASASFLFARLDALHRIFTPDRGSTLRLRPMVRRCPHCRRLVRAEHAVCNGNPRATCAAYGCGRRIVGIREPQRLSEGYCERHAAVRMSALRAA